MHRKYDDPKTPYQRVMESQGVEEKLKQGLMKAYISLNPAQLKRAIDDKLNKLYKVYQQKNKSQEVISIRKKLQPSTVTFLVADSKPLSVT